MSNYHLAVMSIVAFAVSSWGCNGNTSRAQTSGGSASPAGTAAADTTCKPLETRDAQVPNQRPAFEAQTRACEAKSNVAFDVTVLAKGLDHPWAVEPLPGGDLLVTEKPGGMRIVSAKGQVSQPIAGVLKVDARGQGGLLDVALSPSFDSDRTVFWSFSEPREGGNGTSVARAVLSSDRSRLEQVKVIFRARPTYDGTLHYGSRLVFGTDGMLFVTLGDRSDKPMRRQAQQLDSHMGKVLRITPDGQAPKDNPFVGKQGALPEIWSLGHRNIQAAGLDGEGQLWIVEHGTNGGDELNRIEKGKNYGWPRQAYGEEYSGSPIEGASPAPGGFEQPVYYWDPVLAPSGMQFYTGDAASGWKGDLFIGALREQRLVRLELEDNRVTGEEHLLTDRSQRVRDVKQGPDGALYLVTDRENGQLWKVVPRR